MASGARYAGKVVVVTGAARGIGAGIARAFADSGAQVVICDKDERSGRALEQELRGAVFIRCDVTLEEDVRSLLSDTVRRFGRLDCVVNNAGSHPPLQPFEETTAQGFRELLELNLLGTYTLCKLALPHLRKSRGNIINISSLVGAVGQLQGVPYAATKGAVTALTKALALDESQYGVRVNWKYLDPTVAGAGSPGARPQGRNPRGRHGPAPGPHGPARGGGGGSCVPGVGSQLLHGPRAVRDGGAPSWGLDARPAPAPRWKSRICLPEFPHFHPKPVPRTSWDLTPTLGCVRPTPPVPTNTEHSAASQGVFAFIPCPVGQCPPSGPAPPGPQQVVGRALARRLIGRPAGETLIRR